MAFFDALRAIFTPPPGIDLGIPLDRVVFMGEPEERSLSFSQMWNTGLDTMAPNTAAGVPVTIETAIRNIAVQAAIRLLVNDIGSLPVDAFRTIDGNSRKELTRPSWVVEPNPLNPNATWEDHVKQTVFGLLTDGNAFTRCFPNTFRPEAVEALDPKTVDIKSFRGTVEYHVKGEGVLTPADVIHLPWFLQAGKLRGLNPIETGREGLGIAIAADEFVGEYFGNGAILSGVIGFPAGSDPTDDQIAAMKTDFARKHVGRRKHHAVGALTGGAEFKQFDYNNRDAQLLELRDQIVEEVARLFQIPPFMLGSQKPGAVGYNSVEQRAIDYVTHAILPIVKRIEVGYSRLLRGQKTYLRFNLEGLKRGDAAARGAYYTELLAGKVIRREEVRALEELPFDGELGYLETPNNNAPQAAVREDPTPINVSTPVTITEGAFRADVHAAPISVTSPIELPRPPMQTVTKREVDGSFTSTEQVAEGMPTLLFQPEVHIDSGAVQVNVEPTPVEITVPTPKPRRTRFERDKKGLITASIEVEGEDRGE